MIEVPRLASQSLLGPEDMPPTREDFEVVGAFNPGAVRLVDGRVILLVRVAERPKERRAGFTPLPRWDASIGLTVDWVADESLEPIDPRVVIRRSDGLVRLTFTSHLRVVRLGIGGRSVESIDESTFLPAGETEEFGVEDPRITPIDGRYYFTYVAVSKHGPATALASTSDFKTYERHGVIFCPENKDVVLFPGRIGGRHAALHRPVCGTPFTRPEIWTAQSPDLIHWGSHRPLRLGGGDWQSGRVGAGCPPVRVEGGWLAIYHGNRRPERPGDVGTYYGAGLLLDPDDPSRVVRGSTSPLFRPELDYEIGGFVDNVVFPTGVVTEGDRLLIYYGAADCRVGLVEFSTAAILESLVEVGT